MATNKNKKAAGEKPKENAGAEEETVSVPKKIWEDIEEGLFKIHGAVRVLRMHADGYSMTSNAEPTTVIADMGNTLRMVEETADRTSRLTEL